MKTVLYQSASTCQKLCLFQVGARDGACHAFFLGQQVSGHGTLYLLMCEIVHGDGIAIQEYLVVAE